MAPQIKLEDTRITRKGDTSSQVAPPSSKMVAGGMQCAPRSTIIPTKTCSADIYRRIKRRLGCLFKDHTAHKLPGTKGGLFGPKGVPKPLPEQHSSYSHRQHHSGRGAVKSGPLCPLLWRILTLCTSKQVTLKAQHIPGQLNVVADKVSRLG